MGRFRFQMISLALLLAAGGCVQRTLTVRSNPPGALVYLNDQEIGRTPFTRPLTWYGTYDVEVRLEGYQSIKTTASVWAPWWQWVPFDLFTELLPLTDRHDLSYTLREPSERQMDATELVARGEGERDLLQVTARPTTAPTTRPAKSKPKKKS